MMNSHIINWLSFFGFRYECPLCGRRYRKLIPFGSTAAVWKEKNVTGGGYRPNVICPNPACGSFDRERMLYLYLQKMGFFDSEARVLHIAPEKNISKIISRCPNIYCVSTDLASPLADVKMDIAGMALRSSFFDAVICNHVLEHVVDDKGAIAEIYRVLKPGGWAIIQVPTALSLQHTYEDPAVINPDDRERHYGQFDHVRLYAPDFIKRLEHAGFQARVDRFSTSLAQSTRNKYAVNPSDIIYFCSKPTGLR